MKAKSEDIGFLIKFVEEKWLPSFLKGNINFSPLSFFKDKAKEDNDGFIADEKEGSYKIHLPKSTKFKMFVPDTGEIITEFKSAATIQTELEENDKGRIGCASFFYISMDDMVIDSENKEDGETVFALKKSVQEYFKKFNTNHRIPVLINIRELCNVLDKDTTKQKSYGRVNYYKNSLHEFVNAQQKGVPYAMIPFYKDERFKEQREWRIVTKLDEVRRRQCVNFGDISKFSTPLTEDAVNRICLIVGGIVKKADE